MLCLCARLLPQLSKSEEFSMLPDSLRESVRGFARVLVPTCWRFNVSTIVPPSVLCPQLELQWAEGVHVYKCLDTVLIPTSEIPAPGAKDEGGDALGDDSDEDYDEEDVEDVDFGDEDDGDDVPEDDPM